MLLLDLVLEKEKNKMARVQRNIRKHFLITEELDAKLKLVSEERNESQNEIANNAISAYLKRFKKDDEKQNERNDG